MPYASIDIGSNTLRLLIGEIQKNNRIVDICSQRKITRLADGIDKTGKLSDKNMRASLAVLKEFSSLISRHKVTHVKAVATSALREASNSDIFIQKAFADTGISIEVISGKKEAELTMKGIFPSLPDSFLMAQHSALIVDIGGGSTEWILCKGRHPVDMGSIPLGVIKLYGNCVKTDPVSEDDIAALNREIVPGLENLQIKIEQHKIDTTRYFIGTAGTFTTLASLDLKLDTYAREKIHLHRIPLQRLKDIRKKLFALSLEERKKLKGLEPGRADLIIPGIQFTMNIMDRLLLDELIVSDYGLLEGVLLEIPEEE